MTEQSNAELIAEVNEKLASHQWTSGWGVESLAERLAAALEAADQLSEIRGEGRTPRAGPDEHDDGCAG